MKCLTTTLLLALAIAAAAAPMDIVPVPSKAIKQRQGSFDFGSLTSGLSSSSSGSSSSGLGSLGSLGGSSAATGSSSAAAAASTATTASSGSTGSTGSSGASSGGCKAVTLLFARGTGEPGEMGFVIGPPLATALSTALGEDKFTSEGVDYPASAAGNADLGASGGTKMATQAQSILSSCPQTKLVLGGYSQGAMVVHNTLSAQGLDGSKVAAVVAFGDPFNGQDFEGVDAAKTKEFCGSADGLCSAGGSNGSGSHLSYGADADAASEFIVGVVGK